MDIFYYKALSVIYFVQCKANYTLYSIMIILYNLQSEKEGMSQTVYTMSPKSDRRNFMDRFPISNDWSLIHLILSVHFFTFLDN